MNSQELREKRMREFAKSHNHDALANHWSMVRSHEVSIEDVLFGKKHNKVERNQVLDYEVARHYVIQIIADKYPPKIEGKLTSFETNDQLKKLLENLTKYFINDNTGSFSLDKGILMYGSVGTGKTSLFRIYERLAGALDIKDGYDKKFKIEKTSNIVLDVRAKENEGFMKQYFNNNYCFDDLGKEPKEVKIYGNSSTIMGDILFNRYDRNVLTHATTNLSAEELLDHYGDRIHSRMHEMFNWVNVTGKDFRK